MIYVQDGAAQERDKYAEIWQFEDYRKYSPGDDAAVQFLDVMKPAPCSTVVDIGCGQGGAGLKFENAGLDVTWVDITDSALLPGVRRSRFIQRPLWEDWSARQGREWWDFGFCVDVLEHIPTEYVMLCIDRITRACRLSWLQICNQPDGFGKKIGEPLHLTVRPFSWWLIRLDTISTVVDARDLSGHSLFIVEPK